MTVSHLIFRNSVTAILQVIVSAIVLFVLYRYLLETLGVEQLGVWSVLLASVTAARVSELGLSGSVTRFVARYLAKGELENAAGIVETGLISIAIIMAVLLCVAYPLLEWILTLVLPREAIGLAYEILPYAVLAVWLGSLNGVALAGLDGCQRIDLRGILLVISHLFYLALALALVPKFGLKGLALGQVTQNLFILVVGWFLMRRELPVQSLIPRKWHISYFKEMLGYGAQFQLAGIAMILYDLITKSLLSRFGGLAAVGYFEMASQMVVKLRAVLLAGNQVMVPTLAEVGEHSASEVRKLYQDSYSVMLFLSLPFFAGIIASTALVSELWIGHSEPFFINFAIMLAVGWLLNTINGPAYFANLGSGELQWNTIGHIIIGILNITLGIILGIVYGSYGVVFAWSIALGLGSMVVLLAYHRKYGLELKRLLPRDYYLLFVACLAVASGCPLIILKLVDDWSLAGQAGIFLLMYITIIGVPIWLHPMRRRLIAWIYSNLRVTFPQLSGSDRLVK